MGMKTPLELIKRGEKCQDKITRGPKEMGQAQAGDWEIAALHRKADKINGPKAKGDRPKETADVKGQGAKGLTGV